MNTDLTDAEWALVADLFERDGQRGAPAHRAPRRCNTCCASAPRWRIASCSPASPPSQPDLRSPAGRRRACSRPCTTACANNGVTAWAKRPRRQRRSSMRKAPAAPRRVATLGFDAGKKVKGRKRHLVVDTLGLLLAVTVTAASVQDRDAAAPVVARPRQSSHPAEALRRCRLRRPMRHDHRSGPRHQRGDRAPPRQPQQRHLARRSAAPVARNRAQRLRRTGQALGGGAHSCLSGTSVPDASWLTMTAPTGPPTLGSGSPKRVCSQPDWLHRSFRLHPLSPGSLSPSTKNRRVHR